MLRQGILDFFGCGCCFRNDRVVIGRIGSVASGTHFMHPTWREVIINRDYVAQQEAVLLAEWAYLVFVQPILNC